MGTKRKAAYGYPRVSGPSQEKGESIPSQKRRMAAFAKSHGIRVVEWFAEVWTGTEADRPEYQKMITAMKTNGVEIIIVDCMDRFTRDLTVQGILLTRLCVDGFTLLSADNGRDITVDFVGEPCQRAIVQMLGVFAELDKNQRVFNMRRGKRDKVAAAKRRGEDVKVDGNYAFGEHPDILEEISVLKRIGQLRRRPRYGKRLTYQKVADTLNAEGLPTRAALLASQPDSKREPRLWLKQAVWEICKRHGW